MDEGEKPNYEPALVGDLYIHRILLVHVKHPTSIKYRDVPKSEWKYELLYDEKNAYKVVALGEKKKKGLKTLLPRSFSRVLEVYTLKYLSKSGNEDINFYYIGCHPLSDKTRDFPRSS